MAATYGWSARRVEHELTDELLVLYLDEATDRIAARAQADFDAQVEAVRAGTIFAHDGKQHAKWIRSKRVQRPGLTGQALEAAVMRIGQLFPDNVIRGTA